MFHFDLHAEETSIPEIFVDRMDEDPAVLQRLIASVRPIGLPFVLDYPFWREMGRNQSLSAATAARDYASVTIEEGKTKDPDIFARKYIAWKLLEHLERLGFVSIHKTFRQMNMDMFNLRYLSPGLKKSDELWSVQFEGKTIYCLEDILPELTDIDGSSISGEQLLTQALEKQGWDGILSLVYKSGLRGSKGRDFEEIGKILFGSWLWRDYLKHIPAHNAIVRVDNFPKDSWILSVAEPPDPNNRIVHYAFFADETGKKQELELDIIDTEEKRRTFLTPDKLREFLNGNSEMGIDLSILEVTCAIPDPIWKGDKGKHLLDALSVLG